MHRAVSPRSGGFLFPDEAEKVRRFVFPARCARTARSSASGGVPHIHALDLGEVGEKGDAAAAHRRALVRCEEEPDVGLKAGVEWRPCESIGRARSKKSIDLTGPWWDKRLEIRPKSRCVVPRRVTVPFPRKGLRRPTPRRIANDAQEIPVSPRRGSRRLPDPSRHRAAQRHVVAAAKAAAAPTPIRSSICSATCSSGSGPTMSRSPTTPSWSRARSTA